MSSADQANGFVHLRAAGPRRAKQAAAGPRRAKPDKRLGMLHSLGLYVTRFFVGHLTNNA